MGWESYPQGLFDLLQRIKKEYDPRSIFITENGASYPDKLTANKQILDERRIAFLHAHLAELHRAIECGVPVSGYFLWSLMDNFEWERGYSQRFGIVWVDYLTQERILKQSAHWYKNVIATHALPDGATPPG